MIREFFLGPPRQPLWARLLWWLSSPLALFPIGFVVAKVFGRYTPEDIGSSQTIPLFLQGSTDWGGSDTFAAVVALYVVCGFLGALHLSLLLDHLDGTDGTLRRAGIGTARLAIPWALFLGLGGLSAGADRGPMPRDFRDLFLLAALVFVLSTFWIAWLSRRRIRPIWKVALAPLFIYFWLVIGSDGTTTKAGQILNSGDVPSTAARGVRHGLMLEWHALCDAVLGGPAPKSSQHSASPTRSPERSGGSCPSANLAKRVRTSRSTVLPAPGERVLVPRSSLTFWAGAASI
jgi:hypothetical protein